MERLWKFQVPEFSRSSRTPVWFFLMGLCLFPELASGGAAPLQISTATQVTDQGEVSIALTLKNTGTQPLYHVQPMFHFHHTMSRMPMVPELQPQQSLTIENDQHPPVLRVGSYPVVAMVNYKKSLDEPHPMTKIHTDSFSYGEPMISTIDGKISSEVDWDQSVLKILLRNNSSSFKNVRMMLLLPPDLAAKNFKGLMGFTIRSGEMKSFEVPVFQVAGRTGGNYPVHLLVEYGEMLNHYSGEIRGHIKFGPWGAGTDLWPQMLVFVFLSVTLFMAFRRGAGLRKQSNKRTPGC